MNRVDLTSQFIIYIALILVGVIGGMNFWFYHDHTSQIKESIDNKIIVKMDFLESSVGYFIAHFEYELISGLGNKTLLADRDIVSLRIEDSAGKVLFEAGDLSEKNIKSYTREILNRGDKIGLISLSLDMSQIIEDRKKTLVIIIALMIFSISLIGGMIYVFYHKKIVHEFDKMHYEQLELTHRAHHDHLTSLPNRTLFNDRLQEAFKQARRQSSLFSVLFVDLDDFKPINDEYGHDAGDLILKVVSQRMLSVMRETDTVARLGGDEFGVLLLNVKSKETVHELAARLLDVISDSVPYGDELLEVGASIGVAFYGDGIRDAKELINMADAAMYEAKAAGKNNYFCYEEGKLSASVSTIKIRK